MTAADTDMPPVDRAKLLLADRRRMERYFNPLLFADAARDMLLDLFIAAEERRDLSETDCCTSALVPPATARRWIAALEEEALLERHGGESGGDRAFVRLTDHARGQMLAFLTAPPAG